MHLCKTERTKDIFTHTQSVTRIQSTYMLADTLMPDTTEEITTQVMTPAETKSLLPDT